MLYCLVARDPFIVIGTSITPTPKPGSRVLILTFIYLLIDLFMLSFTDE